VDNGPRPRPSYQKKPELKNLVTGATALFLQRLIESTLRALTLLQWRKQAEWDPAKNFMLHVACFIYEDKV
jgi:hypothetical protein